MKRAFIRLFGCILSAIGLSMSYDTTFTILLDDDSAPGALWASGTGTGSGAGVFSEGAVPTVPNSIIVSGLSGSCSSDVNGVNAGYSVVLSSWYVGWMNHNYSGWPTAISDWPVVTADSIHREMNLTFSGTYQEYSMIGNFSRTDSMKGGATSDFCTGSYGIALGVATGLGDDPVGASWRNSCVRNVDEVVVYASSQGTTSYGAVYVPVATPFIQAGCCLVTSSSYATGTGCKCFYGTADRSYSYTGYITAGVGLSAQSVSTATVPFYQPYVLYWFEGCRSGFYMNSVMTGTDANFALDLLTSKYTEMDLTETVCITSRLAGSTMPVTDTADAYYNNIWYNCGSCPTMDSISNVSSFSPTITSNGTMSLTASDSGTGISTCNATVNGAKDATGTFNIVGSCSYN
ncbi:MAG: hypothetical protein IJ517_02820 [Alphaproteobacteria bacterium]|nr:hypothetical protein [Alphaproteobacteria bacterium]